MILFIYVLPAQGLNISLHTACRTLQHLPPSLLELEYCWENLWESAPATLDLTHLTALTKLTTGVCGRK